MLHAHRANRPADLVQTAPVTGRFGNALWAAFRKDAQKYTGPVALLRLLRKSRITMRWRSWRELAALAPFRQHVAANNAADPLFFLSHRHYLARGLSPRKRLAAALAHYRHEATAFSLAYIAQVYKRGGLALWSETRDGITYAIRLTPGNDVAHEGGLSIVMTVDGVRICVLSFSVVPAGLMIHRAALQNAGITTTTPLIFITRKHLSRDRAYQSAFNKAFDRTTPAHLCMGALAGLAQAQGIGHALGIEPAHHPAFNPKMAATFTAAYADFWQGFGGVKVTPYGYLIALPLQQPPLDQMDRQKRARARNRRTHIAATCTTAHAAIMPYLASLGSVTQWLE